MLWDLDEAICLTPDKIQSSMHQIFTQMYSTVSIEPAYMDSPMGFSLDLLIIPSQDFSLLAPSFSPPIWCLTKGPQYQNSKANFPLMGNHLGSVNLNSDLVNVRPLMYI